MKLDDALAGVTHLGFDTSPLIYFVEQGDQAVLAVARAFAAAALPLKAGFVK